MQKILMIDDDPDIRYLLIRYLKKNDFDVLEADSGKAALEELVKSKPDLILCDFILSDMDGIELLKEINERRHTIPVIIMTGYEDIKIAEEVKKLGAFDYFIKPIISDEILLSIRRALTGVDLKQKLNANPTARKTLHNKIRKNKHIKSR